MSKPGSKETALPSSEALLGALVRSLSVVEDPRDPRGVRHPLVNVLTVVILGGRTTLLGPIMGAAIMAILPELARPLAEFRPAVNGVILILVITFLPNGVGDEIVFWLRRRRRPAANTATTVKSGEAKDAVTTS